MLFFFIINNEIIHRFWDSAGRQNVKGFLKPCGVNQNQDTSCDSLKGQARDRLLLQRIL
jgi:hypothetical protein